MLGSFVHRSRFKRSLPVLLLVVFGLTVSSCDKDRLKEPTPVDLAFQVENEDPEVKDQGGGPSVDLELEEKGELHIREIHIMGQRKEGEDVDFSRETSIDLPLKDGKNGPSLRFDLPQGTYKELKLRLKLANGGKDILYCDGERIEKPVVGPQQATPFRLNIEDERTIECEVQELNGKGPIELRKDEKRKLRIKIRPGKWFEGIPKGKWMQATVVPNGGNPIIPIRKDKNVSIHSEVSKRIEKGFKSILL